MYHHHHHHHNASRRLVHRLFTTYPPPAHTTSTTSTSTRRPLITLAFRRGSHVLAFCSLVAATTHERCLPPSSAACLPAGSTTTTNNNNNNNRGAPSRRRTSSKANPNEDGGEEDDVGILARALGPVGGPMTMGLVVGFASGWSLKKIGKAAAFFIGLSFLASQTLSHMGYLSIDWGQIERHLEAWLDQDGDGRLTRRDVEIFWAKLKAALTHQLPSTTGFVSGFALGLHKG